MIERILKLLDENNINAKTLTLETGLPNSSITEWKKGRAKPSTEAIAKIAEYFNVSTDYIILGKDNLNSLTEREIELLNLFRKIKSEKLQDRFIGKAELIIEEMAGQDMKKDAIG